MKKNLFVSLLTVGLVIAGFSMYSGAQQMNQDGNRPPRPPFPFLEMDSNGDGSISVDEWNTFNDSKFKEMDQNGDEKITKEEVKNYFDKMRPVGIE